MTATTATPGRLVLTELGCYSTPDGARILRSRTNQAGTTFISDEPASRRGARSVTYGVDVIPDADGQGAIDALALDYLEQARSLCASPMAPAEIEADLKAAA